MWLQSAACWGKVQFRRNPKAQPEALRFFRFLQGTKELGAEPKDWSSHCTMTRVKFQLQGIKQSAKNVTVLAD